MVDILCAVLGVIESIVGIIIAHYLKAKNKVGCVVTVIITLVVIFATIKFALSYEKNNKSDEDEIPTIIVEGDNNGVIVGGDVHLTLYVNDHLEVKNCNCEKVELYLKYLNKTGIIKERTYAYQNPDVKSEYACNQNGEPRELNSNGNKWHIIIKHAEERENKIWLFIEDSPYDDVDGNTDVTPYGWIELDKIQLDNIGNDSNGEMSL